MLVAACLVAGAVPAAAQAGMGTDIITGAVRDPDGRPIPDANIEAYSLETQVTRRSRSDERGRYTILFPDGGGQYRMTARAVGMAARIELIQRHADEDRLVWNVTLSGGAVTLEEINVRAGPSMVRAPEGPTPGSSERAFLEGQVARLPIEVTDLAVLTGLVPGVVTFGATDTTATQFSVAGQGTEANALTLDGLLFGNSSLPQEGLRQTRVVTSTYDVGRGQFSGGLIAATTRSGSNVVQGASSYQLRDDDLAVAEEDSPYSRGFTQHSISGGLGGPLVRDRVFWFGSFQARLRSDPQQTLLSANAGDYLRLGVHPDSVARFQAIVDSLGVPPRSVPGGATRSNTNLSALLRLDLVLSNSHTLTLRGDWRGTGQDPTRLGALALPQTGGVMETGGGGVAATVTSRFGATLFNELRLYAQASRRDGDPFTAVPQGRVEVASDLPDGTRSVSALLFGGNTGLPSRSSSRSLEASNEVSWMPGSGVHRLKLGGFALADGSDDVQGANRYGSFTFQSLGDLAGGRAATFRRTLSVPERESRSYRWGLYAGDVWMLARTLQLTYGLRLEGSSFGEPPPYNPAVDTAFGRRTDRLPSEVRLSPRAGFSLSLGGVARERGRFVAPPTTVIRGGIGEFRSQPPVGLVAQARGAPGLDQSFAEVVCTGAGVPVPAWGQYWSDPAAIPAACSGQGGPAQPQAPRAVVLVSEDFQAARAWRASLGVERRLTQIFRLTVEGSLARGVAQQGFRDLNLDAAPGFTLPSEGGRPVYVAPQDIAPSSGAPRFAASRVDTAFGQVLEARSGLGSRTEQVTVGLGGVVGRGILLQASYTWQRVRSQASGVRGGSTAGDPNAAEWARSELERRHGFLVTGTYPFSLSLELTAIGRASSGAPFTPLVGGDVNGDGSRNDRAFVFAPGGATAQAAGMERLLAGAAPRIRECLARQVGTVAARSSCTGPWQASLDFQLNWRPSFAGLNRRLTVSVVTVNALRGLDELLHGRGGARGWGIATRPDNTLLYVTGFDPAARSYSYTVNERFGSTAGTAVAARPPFQVGVQMRFSIGPDRMRQALDAMRGGGRGGPGMGGGMGAGVGRMGPATSPAQMLARIESALPNPAGSVLAMRDSLRLTPAQVALLEPERDSLAAKLGVRLDSLRSELDRAGRNPNPMELLPRLRPLFESARTDVGLSLATVRAILTPGQWELVPAEIRSVQIGPRPGQRPGQGQRPGPGTPRP